MGLLDPPPIHMSCAEEGMLSPADPVMNTPRSSCPRGIALQVLPALVWALLHLRFRLCSRSSASSLSLKYAATVPAPAGWVGA